MPRRQHSSIWVGESPKLCLASPRNIKGRDVTPPVPSLQHDDSREEVMGDVSDIADQNPTQILPLERSLDKNTMLSPKVARHGRRLTLPHMIRPNSSDV